MPLQESGQLKFIERFGDYTICIIMFEIISWLTGIPKA